MRLPDSPPYSPLHLLIEHNRDTRQANYCWLAVARRTRAASVLLHAQASALLECSQMIMQSWHRVAQCRTRKTPCRERREPGRR